MIMTKAVLFMTRNIASCLQPMYLFTYVCILSYLCNFNIFSRKTNRLEEALNIFDTIVNNVNFKGISIILFLNKSDLLARKVSSAETDIRWYYPNFTGDAHNLREVQMYLLNMFANVRREPKTTLYHHFTTAIDTKNIEVVFNSVKDTILNRNLESLMLQ